MNILGFNIQISRQSSAPAPVQKSFSPHIDAFLAGDPVPRSRALLSNAYEQVVWVYRAVNAIAEQVANIPFLFTAGERGRENLISSGPLVDFYDCPHPGLTRFQYWELRVLWLLLRGECFRLPIYKHKGESFLANGAPLFSCPADRAGISASSLRQAAQSSSSRKPSHLSPASVLILNPDHLQHIVENHHLLGWRYTGAPKRTPLESQVFLPEEIWFDKLPNPFDFWRGLSPLSVATLASQTDFAAASLMHSFLENNATFGTIVRSEQPLADEQREQIIAVLRQRRLRAPADRSLFLWGCDEISEPTLSSADLQFLENRKFSRSEICAAFGVPEEIVATTDHNK